jgi:predicted nucleic acid-binding protein
MRGPLTIDTSVFISALNPAERRHEESARLLQLLRDQKPVVILPTLVRVELAGAVARPRGDAEAGRQASRLTFLATRRVFVDLDDRLAEEAAELAATTVLEGADAVFVAVARKYDAVLISLDRDQLEKAPPVVAVCDPLQALSL